MAAGEMFGAPAGISAAQQDIRENLLAGVKAQEVMGKIAQQPLEAEVLRQHGRYYGAEADVKLAGLRDIQLMSQLGERMAAQGRVGTVEDLDAVQAGPKSQATPLEQMVEMAQDAGVSELTLTKMRKDIALIRQREAAGAASQSAQVLSGLKQQEEQNTLIGSSAQALLAGGPEQFSQRLMALADRVPPELAKVLGKVPQDFYAARPILEAAIANSMRVKDRIEADRKAERDKALAPRITAQTAAANARTAESKERLRLTRIKADNEAKYGGPNAEASIAAKYGTAASKQAYADNLDRAHFKALPLLVDDVIVGEFYKDRQGRRVEIIGKDARGMPIAQPVSEARVKSILQAAAKGKSPAVRPAPVEDEGDEDDDEGDE